jgi:hypothetical protein
MIVSTVMAAGLSPEWPISALFLGFQAGFRERFSEMVASPRFGSRPGARSPPPVPVRIRGRPSVEGYGAVASLRSRLGTIAHSLTSMRAR